MISLSARRQQHENPGNSTGSEKRRRPDPEQIVFSATVPVEMREAVEALFFFNPRQSLLRSAISSTVERTGIPRIVESDGRVWIDVPSRAMQCLFACDSALKPSAPVGVVLYERPSMDVLSISHLAVHPAYAFGGEHGGGGLGLILIERIREIARRIKGITRVQVPYRNQCFLRI
jgi:hypothetical protein